MKKTILITGATDGIGLAAAKLLAASGHNLIIHGRNAEKLTDVKTQLLSVANVGTIETFLADLSQLSKVKTFAEQVIAKHKTLDVLINNAGVFKVKETRTQDGLDVRFSVNTFAPYILTQKLAPLLGATGRVVNLSSAAQADVNIDALTGKVALADMEAYAQSKLAITMWSQKLADRFQKNGPIIFAVNPGSLLASKMVKEGFGVAGKDINIGAKILIRLSLEDGLEDFSGHYFDNDKGEFSLPIPAANNPQKSEKIIAAMDEILSAKQ